MVAPRRRKQRVQPSISLPRLPTPPPTSPPSSSSSSDSDYRTSYAYIPHKHAYTQHKMAPSTATVEHPIMSAGEATPQRLLLLENAFGEYFIVKSIAETDQVKHILGAFKCVHIRDWIASDCARLLSLSFEEFMQELRNNYLPSDWVKTIRSNLLSMQMTKATRFWDWAQDVRALNLVLKGTTSHLDDTSLRNQLEAGLETSLRAECARDDLYKVTVLKDWMERVKKVDERLNFERKRYREIFMEESALRSAKRPFSSSSRAANVSTNSSSSSSNVKRPFSRLPKLLDSEKDLLSANAGCFKCRRFNTDCKTDTNNCPGFPSGSGYKTITNEADAAGKPGKKIGITNSKGKVVASVTTEDSDEDDIVAAFAPTSTLGDGTDSGLSDTVSDIAPLKCKHFVWKCFVDGPLTEFPLRTTSLVDNGCHLVLIRPELVAYLGLLTDALQTPELVDVAIKDTKTKKKLLLSHFVILRATSLDQLWTSRPVRALLAPGLCTPIIFGLPFLSHNHIITDHELRSCVDKKNGYNLLHPTPVSPLITPPSPKIKREQIKKQKKLALSELKAVCAARWLLIQPTLEPVKEMDIAAAIKSRVETLASISSLQEHEAQLRSEYSDLFEPIPHVHKLPTDCLAEIKLKDPTLRVKTRSYTCPRKYRDAWKILLSQHLAAGCIHPSSSLHASPAFIVPKADPTALPRWVNDYR